MSSGMKKSGIDWIGKIPSEWNVVRAKTIFTNHKTIVGKKSSEYERLALTLKGVIKRSKDDSNGLQPEAFDGYQVLNPGELVFKLIDLENLQTSRVGLSPYCGIVSPAYIILTPDMDKVIPEFAEMYFLSMWQRAIFNHMGDDGVRSSLSSKDLLNAPIVLPSKVSQFKISSFLKKRQFSIDRIISEMTQSINDYKKLRQSIITEAVMRGVRGVRKTKNSGIEWLRDIPYEWSVNKIKNVSIFNPNCKCVENDAMVTYTPMENIKNGYFIDNSIEKAKVPASLTSYENGDIVLAKVTPCFENMNIALMDNLSNGIGYGSSELFVLRPTNIFADYLFYWLQNFYFIDMGIATMTGTGGLKRVSPYYVKNSFILVPPKDEQEEISEYIEKKCRAIDNLITVKKKIIAELELYRQSIIYEYVTGKKEVPEL